MCVCKLKSLDTTATFVKTSRLSKGIDSRRLSMQMTTDSMPAVVNGRVDSKAASSEGWPLAAGLPLAGGGAFALGSAFLESAAPLAPGLPVVAASA